MQIGYFKAKQIFFNFKWEDISSQDIDFLMEQYFSDKQLVTETISQYEYYTQIKQITEMYGYRLWKKEYTEILYKYVTKTSKRDVSISFILSELLQYIQKEKIVRPGYTTLQDIISSACNEERERLGNIINNGLNEASKEMLKTLLSRDDIVTYLTTLKQDAKDFGYRMMVLERKKLETIKPLYILAKELLPKLDISRQNILYYSDLINYYTIYELRQLKTNKSYLYLLCYIWQRYLQLTDNLINAFQYHLKQFEDGIKQTAEEKLTKHAKNQQGQYLKIGKLLQLYVDENVSDDLTFGEIRKMYAYSLMPEETIKNTAHQMIQKPITEPTLKWKAVDSINHKFKKHLRPIFMALDFTSNDPNNPWLNIINQLKESFGRQINLNKNNDIEAYRGMATIRVKNHSMSKIFTYTMVS